MARIEAPRQHDPRSWPFQPDRPSQDRRPAPRFRPDGGNRPSSEQAPWHTISVAQIPTNVEVVRFIEVGVRHPRNQHASPTMKIPCCHCRARDAGGRCGHTAPFSGCSRRRSVRRPSRPSRPCRRRGPPPSPHTSTCPDEVSSRSGVSFQRVGVVYATWIFSPRPSSEGFDPGVGNLPVPHVDVADGWQTAAAPRTTASFFGRQPPCLCYL